MRVTIPAAHEIHLRTRDWVVAVIVALLAQAEVWTSPDFQSRPAFAAAALAMTAPLVLRRFAPITVLVAVFLPLFALKASGDPLEAVFIMVVLLVAFAGVGAHCERRRAVGGLVLGLLLLLGLLALEYAVPTGEGPPAPQDFVFLGGILTVVWALAVLVRERSLEAGQHADRAARLEREREERARAAVAEERSRIARELHDVVAHSISVIAVQTGSTRRRLRHDRPGEAEELVGVEETARQALADMRRMLGLLRAEEQDVPGLTPQPGMQQLDGLVGQVRAAGLDVEVAVEGAPRALPPGLDLAAYRIVQEALTNVIKHAGPVHTRVHVGYGEREVQIEVEDDGTGGVATADGEGHGLIGMRERVALYGGSVAAGPRPDGGFAVRAVLPVPGA